jgi:hypothetical protein
VRDWARRDRRVARRLKRVDTGAWTTCVPSFAPSTEDEDEVEVRCMLFYSLWIGEHFIAADHGAHSRRDVVKLALRWLESS